MFSAKYRLIAFGLLAGILASASGCSAIPLTDKTGPVIEDIRTSSKVLAKSDCIPTSLTVTANIKDSTGVASATMWYRVGEDQEFAPAVMAQMGHDRFVATVKALDIPGGEYGIFEFYILAQDPLGNQTKSLPDKSVELLRCVG